MDGDTPKPGETQTPKAPENVTPTSAPVQGNADGAGEAEKLRKELEQARMRENQLLNEKKERDAKEDAARAKKLEEDAEFKTLYEQEKAKREAVESERETENRRKELDQARSTALSEYSDDVKTLAEEVGLTLNSADESDVTAFKAKLDNLQKRVGTGKVGPNNPRASSGKVELSPDELKIALKDPAKFQEIVSQRPGIAQMMSKRQ